MNVQKRKDHEKAPVRFPAGRRSRVRLLPRGKFRRPLARAHGVGRHCRQGTCPHDRGTGIEVWLLDQAPAALLPSGKPKGQWDVFSADRGHVERLLRDMGDEARWVAVGKGKLTPGESLPFAVGYEGGRLSVSVTPGTGGILSYSAAFDGAETKDERYVANGRSLLLVFRGDADRLFRVMGMSGERGADAEALLVVVVNVAAE